MNTAIFITLNIALPALMLIAGGVILWIQLHTWLKNPTDTPLPRDRRRYPPSLLVLLGLLLVAPGLLLIAFLAGRVHTMYAARNFQSSGAISVGPIETGEMAFPSASSALSRQALEQLTRQLNIKFEVSPEQVARHYQIQGIDDAAAGSPLAFFAREMATLRYAPRAHFSRLTMVRNPSNIQVTLPLAPSDMDSLNLFEGTRHLSIVVPPMPAQTARGQLETVAAWSRRWSGSNVVIQVQDTSSPDLIDAIGQFPNLTMVDLKMIDNPGLLSRLGPASELETMKLEFAPAATGPLPDFTTLTRLANVHVKYLHTCDDQTLIDLCAQCPSLEKLTISSTPKVTGSFINHLTRKAKPLDQLALLSVPIDDATDKTWETVNVWELQIAGVDPSDKALEAIARNTHIKALVLPTLKLTPDRAKVLAKMTWLVHLIVGEPDSGALPLLGKTPQSTLVIHSPVPTPDMATWKSAALPGATVSHNSSPPRVR